MSLFDQSGADPLSALLALGDDMKRAQEATGIAPVETSDPMYEQMHGPRLEEARERLRELGYEADTIDKTQVLTQFRAEAGIKEGAILDDEAWEALEELRGLENTIDPERWRDESRAWLPAMRRAITTRVDELGLAKKEQPEPTPLAFGLEPEEEAELEETPHRIPSQTESRRALLSLADALSESGTPMSFADPEEEEDQLIQKLFNHEALFAASRPQESETALAFGLPDAPPEPSPLQGQMDRAEMEMLGIEDDDLLSEGLPSTADPDLTPLAFGLGDDLDEADQLFADLISNPDLRTAPDEDEMSALLPDVVDALSDNVDDVQPHWENFLKSRKAVWKGKKRAGSWLKGAARWFRDKRKSLVEGLKSIFNTGRGFLRKITAKVKATLTNVFRVLYHSLAKVFGFVHTATAAFVNFIENFFKRDKGPKAINKKTSFSGDITLFATHSATAKDIDTYIAKLAKRDRTILIASELLGLTLGITVGWAAGPIGGVKSLVSMVRKAPKLLHLGKELVELWSPV